MYAIGPLYSYVVIPFHFTAKKHGVITLFTVASNRRYSGRWRRWEASYELSNTTIKHHRARNCGVQNQTLPFAMHYGGEKLGKEWSFFNPQRTRSYGLGSRLRCKVSSKLSVVGRWTDRQTDVTDVSEFTRGRVRAGPSFQLGTLSTRIANLLCMTLVNVVTWMIALIHFHSCSSSSRKPARWEN